MYRVGGVVGGVLQGGAGVGGRGCGLYQAARRVVGIEVLHVNVRPVVGCSDAVGLCVAGFAYAYPEDGTGFDGRAVAVIGHVG